MERTFPEENVYIFRKLNVCTCGCCYLILDYLARQYPEPKRTHGS